MHHETEQPAAPPYRRPAAVQTHISRAARDWELLGQVEKILDRPPDILAAMVRCEPAKYEAFQEYLAGLVERHVTIVDAATEAHAAIEASLKEEL